MIRPTTGITKKPMMPSTAPANRVFVPTSAARMRFIGHMYLISVVAPISTVTTPSVTHRRHVVLDERPDQDRRVHQQNAGQQRHDDADDADGDRQRDEDDSAGAHGIRVLLGRPISSTLCAVAAPAIGRPSASSKPSCSKHAGLIPVDVLMGKLVTRERDDRNHRNLNGASGGFDAGQHPVHHRGVGETQDELIDNRTVADRAADGRELQVGWVHPDEMV